MRRLPIVVVLTAVLASGCSEGFRGDTWSSDVVARVGDEQLTRDQLADYVAAISPSAPDGDGETARATIRLWIRAAAVHQLLARDGVEVTDQDRDAATSALSGANGIPGFTELPDDVRDEFVGWQTAFALSAQQGTEYSIEAIGVADTWVKPRFGVLETGSDSEFVDPVVIPLALPTAQP